MHRSPIGMALLGQGPLLRVSLTYKRLARIRHSTEKRHPSLSIGTEAVINCDSLWTTKWPEAFATANQEALTIAKELISCLNS